MVVLEVRAHQNQLLRVCSLDRWYCRFRSSRPKVPAAERAFYWWGIERTGELIPIGVNIASPPRGRTWVPPFHGPEDMCLSVT